MLMRTRLLLTTLRIKLLSNYVQMHKVLAVMQLHISRSYHTV